MKNKGFAETPIINEAKVNKSEIIGKEKHKLELHLNNADAFLEKRIRKGKDNSVEFGSPERAKQYSDLAFRYMNEYRAYLRKAKALYDDIIKYKRQPESRMSEVTDLKKKAEAAKKEGDKYNRYARMELNRF